MKTIYLKLLVIFMMSIMNISCFAATRTWTGGTGNTKWDHPNNWDCNCVPANGDNLIIPAGGSSQPTITSVEASTFIPGNITMNAGSILTFTSGTLKMSGSLVINGTLSASGGAFEMSGSTSQTISGTATINFYGLNINTTAGGIVTAGTNFTITNNLSLISGNVDLNTYLVALGTSVANTGTISRTNGTLYNGTFRRWFSTIALPLGDTRGLFPVGYTNDYRPIYINPSGPLVAGGTVDVKYVYVYSTTSVSILDAPVTVVYRNNSYWNVSTGNGFAGASIDMRAGGTGFGLVTSLLDLRLTLANSVVGINGVAVGSLTNPLVARTGISSVLLNNNFYMASANAAAPLPEELKCINARKVVNGVMINWDMASEINVKEYIIEKLQDDLKYAPIATLNPGNTDLKYFYTDTRINDGVQQYRLVKKDKDGNGSVLNSVSIKVNQNNNFTVYPNPGDGNKVNIVWDKNAEVEYLRVLDPAGRTMLDLSVAGNFGSNSNEYSIENLKFNPGIYYVQLITKNNMHDQIQKYMIR